MAPKISNYCKFSGCKNNTLSKDIHLFRFPKEKTRCEAWVKASKNAKLNRLPPLQLNKSAVLCNEHFQDWCFMNLTKKSRLVHNAVPASPKPLLIEDVRTISSDENSANEASCTMNSSLKELLITHSPSSVPASSPQLHKSAVHSKSSLVCNAVPDTTKPLVIKCERISSAIENLVSGASCATNSRLKELLITHVPSSVSTPSPQLHKNAVLSNEHFQNSSFINKTTGSSLAHNDVPAITKPLVIKCEKTISANENPESEASCATNSRLKELLITHAPSATDIADANHLIQHIELESQGVTNSSPTKKYPAEKSTRNYSPRERYLARQVRKYREAHRKLDIKFKAYKKKYPAQKPSQESLSVQGVSEKLSNFIQHQVSLNINKKAKRYTEYDKIEAFQIFNKSPAVYKTLRDIVELPSARTLRRFVSSKLTCHRINAETVSALKKIFEGTEKELIEQKQEH